MSVPTAMNFFTLSRFISALNWDFASSIPPFIERTCCSMITVPSLMLCAPTMRPFSMSIISVVPPAISSMTESSCIMSWPSTVAPFRHSVTAMYMRRFSSRPSITRTVKPVLILILSTKGSLLVDSRTALVPRTIVSFGWMPQDFSCSAKRRRICRQEIMVSLLMTPDVNTSRPMFAGSSLLSRILRFLSSVISTTSMRMPVEPISITACCCILEFVY